MNGKQVVNGRASWGPVPLNSLPRWMRARLAINHVIDKIGIELARSRFYPLAYKWWNLTYHLHVYYYPLGRHNEKAKDKVPDER